MRARQALAVAVLGGALGGCGTSDEEHARRLDAACQDNRSRAYAAAGKTTPGSGTTREQALAHMRTYIAEVRKAPECFVRPLREEVERAAEAVEQGRLLPLTYPKNSA